MNPTAAGVQYVNVMSSCVKCPHMYGSTCEHVTARVTLPTCTYSDENLRAAMHDLNVLVVHEAAHDSDVGVALCGADPWSLRHLSPHAAGPVFTPPRVMGRDVKCQQVTVLKEEK